jgi:hypothetical protein
MTCYIITLYYRTNFLLVILCLGLTFSLIKRRGVRDFPMRSDEPGTDYFTLYYDTSIRTGPVEVKNVQNEQDIIKSSEALAESLNALVFASSSSTETDRNRARSMVGKQ